MELYVGTDNLIRITGLEDHRFCPPPYINTATVSATVTDTASGVTVATVSMAYDAGTDGQYSGDVPASAGLVSGHRYLIVITAVAGSITLTIERTLICTEYVG